MNNKTKSKGLKPANTPSIGELLHGAQNRAYVGPQIQTILSMGTDKKLIQVSHAIPEPVKKVLESTAYHAFWNHIVRATVKFANTHSDIFYVNRTSNEGLSFREIRTKIDDKVLPEYYNYLNTKLIIHPTLLPIIPQFKEDTIPPACIRDILERVLKDPQALLGIQHASVANFTHMEEEQIRAFLEKYGGNSPRLIKDIYKMASAIFALNQIPEFNIEDQVSIRQMANFLYEMLGKDGIHGNLKYPPRKRERVKGNNKGRIHTVILMKCIARWGDKLYEVEKYRDLAKEKLKTIENTLLQTNGFSYDCETGKGTYTPHNHQDEDIHTISFSWKARIKDTHSILLKALIEDDYESLLDSQDTIGSSLKIENLNQVKNSKSFHTMMSQLGSWYPQDQQTRVLEDKGLIGESISKKIAGIQYRDGIAEKKAKSATGYSDAKWKGYMQNKIGGEYVGTEIKIQDANAPDPDTDHTSLAYRPIYTFKKVVQGLGDLIDITTLSQILAGLFIILPKEENTTKAQKQKQKNTITPTKIILSLIQGDRSLFEARKYGNEILFIPRGNHYRNSTIYHDIGVPCSDEEVAKKVSSLTPDYEEMFRQKYQDYHARIEDVMKDIMKRYKKSGASTKNK